MTPSEETIEAAEKKIVQAITGFVREHRTISSEELTKDVLAAALPAIEKEIRAQVAAELRGELPAQLAETAGSDTGWLYDMSDWGPCPSEGNEHVNFRDENVFNIGSIDLHLIAGIAARIAEGADHA